MHALRRHDAASNARTFTPFILQSHQPTMTIREAAIDPTVKSIKINVYRVAHNSQIMNALLNAVNNGKEVLENKLPFRFSREGHL